MSRLAVLSVLLLLGCQPSVQTPSVNADSAPEIVGGREAQTQSRYAKQVAKISIMTARGGALCTGTFITPHTFLTAAHCFESGEAITNIEIDLGVNETQTLFHTSALSWIVNEKYPFTKASGDDLALVRTRDELPADFVITELATKRMSGGKPAAAVGFGINFYDPMFFRLPSDADQSAKLRVVLLKTKFDWWLYNKTLVVDLGLHRGVSHGDSGGPLFVIDSDGRTKQIGVTSTMESNGRGSLSATYCSVVANLPWINKTIDNLLKDHRQ